MSGEWIDIVLGCTAVDPPFYTYHPVESSPFSGYSFPCSVSSCAWLLLSLLSAPGLCVKEEKMPLIRPAVRHRPEVEKVHPIRPAVRHRPEVEKVHPIRPAVRHRLEVEKVHPIRPAVRHRPKVEKVHPIRPAVRHRPAPTVEKARAFGKDGAGRVLAVTLLFVLSLRTLMSPESQTPSTPAAAFSQQRSAQRGAARPLGVGAILQQRHRPADRRRCARVSGTGDAPSRAAPSFNRHRRGVYSLAIGFHACHKLVRPRWCCH